MEKGFRDLLGVEGDQLAALESHLKTLSNKDIKGYLSALLPDNDQGRKLVELVIAKHGKSAKTKGNGSKGQGKISLSPAGGKGKKKGKGEGRSPVASISPSSRGQPQTSQTERERMSRRIITGNEEGDTPNVSNCLECGMIYRIETFRALARCGYCESPLGRSQKKRAQQTLEEGADLTKALERRDRLLEYERTSAERTKVYDDQSDYFEMDVGAIDSKWATDAERETAKEDLAKRKEKADEEANKTYITIDFNKKKIVQDNALSGTVAGQVYERLSRSIGK
mmetsp:Transcript_15467/g.25289  ORF Transcript_15467/g.25289 Transcript_15467/m.25289 type:complete len:282 (+) Transcript_15467:217-1062(+)